MAGQLTQTQSSIDEKFSRRTTEQRRLILEIIRQAEGHLDADEIYRQARQRSPSISLSTVYRSLQLFKELELIEEHQFDGMRRYYETTLRSKHHHLVCLGCGRIFEFNCPSTERLKSKISREEGFRITDAEVRLVGYCPECQRRLSSNMTDTQKQVAERR
jgi:Fur family transcriptional regulator, ferric uptake regulator